MFVPWMEVASEVSEVVWQQRSVYSSASLKMIPDHGSSAPCRHCHDCPMTHYQSETFTFNNNYMTMSTAIKHINMCHLHIYITSLENNTHWFHQHLFTCNVEVTSFLYTIALRSIKRSLPSHALNTLVTNLTHSRLDYRNVAFAGLLACDIQRLQTILNTAWSLAHRDVIPWPLWCTITIDFLLSSVSSTSCAWLFIVVCMAMHHTN